MPELYAGSSPAHWLILAKAPGLGPIRTRKLLHRFSTPEEIINAPIKDLANAKCPANARRWIKHAKHNDIEQELAWLQQPDHHMISILDDRYPRQLCQIHDAPALLFINGNPDILELPQLAIVGSRNPSLDGKLTATQFAKYLAAGGLIVTSGLAQGIDAAAHQGAMQTGQTIAVCATGTDIVYPRMHQNLAQQIKTAGCLVSEFLPGTQARREYFPRRNRLISGLCLGTLVVEASINSGSLITAHMALEQGREVFAIPGSIHNPLSKGCHQLIKQGAKLVETGKDIIIELEGHFQNLKNILDQSNLAIPDKHAAQTDTDQQKVLQCLTHDWLSIDELVEKTGFSADQISAMLLILELENHILSNDSGKYRKL